MFEIMSREKCNEGNMFVVSLLQIFCVSDVTI